MKPGTSRIAALAFVTVITAILLLQGMGANSPGTGHPFYPASSVSQLHRINSSTFNDPKSIAFDSGNGNLYVASHYSNNLTVINGTTDTVTGTLGNVQNATGVRYDPYNGYLVVTNVANRIYNPKRYTSILDPSTDRVIHRFNSTNTAFNTNNGDFYIAAWSTIEVISGSNWSVTGEINAYAHIAGMLFDGPLNTLLVTTYSMHNNVLEFNASAGYRKASYGFGNSPSDYAPYLILERNGSYAYYQSGGSVYTFSVLSGNISWNSTTYLDGGWAVYDQLQNAIAVCQDAAFLPRIIYINASTGENMGNITWESSLALLGAEFSAAVYSPVSGEIYVTMNAPVSSPGVNGNLSSYSYVYAVSFVPAVPPTHKSPDLLYLVYIPAAVIAAAIAAGLYAVYRRRTGK